MKNNVKFFALGFIVCLVFSGLVYGAISVGDVYLSSFEIKLNGNIYTPEMPVLNYQGRTYLALREFGTVTGNVVDFIDNTIIINNSEYNQKFSYDDRDLKSIVDTVLDFYRLKEANEAAPIAILDEILKLKVEGVQDPQYAPENYIQHPNSKYRWTGIKYSDFRNRLWYISDEVLEKYFSDFVEYNGYLYIGGEEAYNYQNDFEYEVLELNIDEKSTQNQCICSIRVKNTKTNGIFNNTFVLARGNGDFVIQEVK